MNMQINGAIAFSTVQVIPRIFFPHVTLSLSFIPVSPQLSCIPLALFYPFQSSPGFLVNFITSLIISVIPQLSCIPHDPLLYVSFIPSLPCIPHLSLSNPPQSSQGSLVSPSSSRICCILGSSPFLCRSQVTFQSSSPPQHFV